MKLYGVDDELPAESWASEVLKDVVPVGPPEDEDTATVDDESDDEVDK